MQMYPSHPLQVARRCDVGPLGCPRWGVSSVWVSATRRLAQWGLCAARVEGRLSDRGPRDPETRDAGLTRVPSVCVIETCSCSVMRRRRTRRTRRRTRRRRRRLLLSNNNKENEFIFISFLYSCTRHKAKMYGLSLVVRELPVTLRVATSGPPGRPRCVLEPVLAR